MSRLARGRKSLYAVGVGLLAFGLCEAYVRATRAPTDMWAITGRARDRAPMSSWAQLDAFCAYRARPGDYGQGGGKTVNEHGMISTPSLEVRKPDGVTRVLFLGGSSTAGTGTLLADAETWPWQVVEGLRAAFPERRFELLNGALGGYSSFESYGRFVQRLRFFEPDLVVLNHGWNELYYFGDQEQVHRWRTLPDGSWGFRASSHQLIAPSLVDHVVWPSQLLTKLRVRLGARSLAGEDGDARKLADDFDPSCLEVWRQNLRLFESAAETLGVELFVCKQATLIVEGLDPAEQARCRYEFHGFDHEAHVRALAGIYRVIDEEVDPARVIDARGLSGVSANFHDHVHPTAAGATRIAQVVGDALQRHLAGSAD